MIKPTKYKPGDRVHILIPAVEAWPYSIHRGGPDFSSFTDARPYQVEVCGIIPNRVHADPAGGECEAVLVKFLDEEDARAAGFGQYEETRKWDEPFDMPAFELHTCRLSLVRDAIARLVAVRDKYNLGIAAMSKLIETDPGEPGPDQRPISSADIQRLFQDGIADLREQLLGDAKRWGVLFDEAVQSLIATARKGDR